MGLAIIALFAIAIFDILVMLWMSRMPQFDSFSIGECLTIPLVVFFFSGIVLRAAGFDVAPWPLLVACYAIIAVLFFVLRAIRENGLQGWPTTVKRSLISALLFSACHFAMYAVVGLLLDA